MIATSKVFVAGLLVVFMLAAFAPSVQAYDTKIENKTRYPVTGTVYLRACKAKPFTAAAGQAWSEGRGICLITAIEASMTVAGKAVPCTKYSSTGTAKANYVITANPATALPGCKVEQA